MLKKKKKEMKQDWDLLPGKSVAVTIIKEFLGKNNIRSQKEVAQLSVVKAAVLITQQQARDLT